jgi:spermidine/putrescine transport system ATP-binding protein
MDEGKIQQIGTPTEIYNEPANSFVADFIGESNILNGTMIDDSLVEFAGHKFECVDKGFGQNVPVDVVIRPEDIYIFEMSNMAQFSGKVTSCIFKGVHYEMMVTTPEGFELLIQDYHSFGAGKTVGLRIKPSDIHVMKKERLCNTFDGIVVDKTHVKFLGHSFKCSDASNFQVGSKVKVNVEFRDIVLQDNEEQGNIQGDVKFILYKGDHYHLTVLTDDREHIYIDTNDIWDDGDRVGISIAPESIHIVKS